MERPFRYIREDFFLGGVFRNLDDLNDQLRHWIDTVANPRVHATTSKIVNAAFSEEEHHCKFLPVAPYRALLRLERRASHEGTVSVGGTFTARRTLPDGASFDVHVLADEIRIFEDGALVASHAPLEGRGQKRLDPMPRTLRPTSREWRRANDSDSRRRRVVRRPLDFYEAVGRRLAAQGVVR